MNFSLPHIPSSTNRPARRVTAQACDACRRRKLKCSGSIPCGTCTAAALECTFSIPHKKGGNQGARATVLNTLRGNHGTAVYTGTPRHSASPSKPFLLDPILIDACINAYMERIHPVVPILTLEILQSEVALMISSPLSRQFLLAFCAYVLTFGNLLASSPIHNTGLGKKFLDEAISLGVQVPADQSHQAIFISFFLYGAYAGLGDYRQGWFYLREATTLFMLHRGWNDSSWFNSKVHGCLFWIFAVWLGLEPIKGKYKEVVISERSHGIRKSRPITIQITPTSPPLPSSSNTGLQHLASIFRPFDELFFSVWNGSRSECSKDWLLSLERDVRTALPNPIKASSEEIANLRVTQLWLQVKLWELFPRFGFLSSESVYECLTFGYPINLARQLTVLAGELPVGSLGIHGIGMTEKIFDIACALADVLSFVSMTTTSSDSPGYGLGPVGYLTQTTTLLAKLPGGEAKFVPLLLAKVTQLLPELSRPLCEAVQVPIMSVEPLSPDSRFIYEEEVTMSLYADLRRSK